MPKQNVGAVVTETGIQSCCFSAFLIRSCWLTAKCNTQLSEIRAQAAVHSGAGRLPSPSQPGLQSEAGVYNQSHDSIPSTPELFMRRKPSTQQVLLTTLRYSGMDLP